MSTQQVIADYISMRFGDPSPEPFAFDLSKYPPPWVFGSLYPPHWYDIVASNGESFRLRGWVDERTAERIVDAINMIHGHHEVEQPEAERLT